MDEKPKKYDSKNEVRRNIWAEPGDGPNPHAFGTFVMPPAFAGATPKAGGDRSSRTFGARRHMIIGIITISAGACITYLNRKELALAWESRQWPHVQGSISDKLFREGVSTDLSNDGTMVPKARRWREMDLLYKYHVENRDYFSTRFDFSVYGLAANTHYYKEREKVPVYYCPTNPALSVLKPGLKSDLVFGPLLIIIGFIMPFL